MMKDLTSPAGYSHIHTNYSVRATAITLWANGLTYWEIMVISGNHNESSLQNYYMPSVQQLCKCSNILVAALGDDKVRPPLQISFWVMKESLLYSSCKFHPSTRLFFFTEQNAAVFSQMFSSCMIGNIHIYNYKP